MEQLSNPVEVFFGERGLLALASANNAAALQTVRLSDSVQEIHQSSYLWWFFRRSTPHQPAASDAREQVNHVEHLGPECLRDLADVEQRNDGWDQDAGADRDNDDESGDGASVFEHITAW